MGRAKLNMELIKKEKVRSTSFHTRKNNLKKKAYELATLCDIKAMVIIYGPKQVTSQAHPLDPEIFPDNPDKVLELINKYKGQSSEDRKKRTTLLPCFFQERNKKALQALVRLRNNNVRSKYPTWDLRFNNFIEEDLRRIAAFLENNIENAKAKLGQMKANNSSSNNNIYCAYLQQQQQQRMLTKERSMDFEVGNQTDKYLFTTNPHQAGFMRVPVPMPSTRFMDHYQDRRMVRFGHDYVSGASDMALYNYPMMAEIGGNITYNNLLREPPNNYDEGRQPIAQHHMEYHPMRLGSTHQMVATSYQVDAHAQFDENRK